MKENGKRLYIDSSLLSMENEQFYRIAEKHLSDGLAFSLITTFHEHGSKDEVKHQYPNDGGMSYETNNYLVECGCDVEDVRIRKKMTAMIGKPGTYSMSPTIKNEKLKITTSSYDSSVSSSLLTVSLAIGGHT